MESLPIDTSNPAVKEYLALVRLQVLTPLSLVISIVTLMVCTFVLNPNLGQVATLYPSSITPEPRMIGAYVLALYILQVGYCLLLALPRTHETKRALIKGCGIPLVLSNWIFALWAISWSLQAFLVSTICLGVLLVLLIYANLVLLIYHVHTTQRPFDLAFIHAPVRAFMLLPLMVLFPYSLFVTLGKTWSPGDPQHYDRGQWSGLLVVLLVNLIGFLAITIRRDVVWCVAATWICASLCLSKPKPYPVMIAATIFTVLHPTGLCAVSLWAWFRGRNELRMGRIALPSDDELHSDSRVTAVPGERTAQDLDADALWG